MLRDDLSCSRALQKARFDGRVVGMQDRPHDGRFAAVQLECIPAPDREPALWHHSKPLTAAICQAFRVHRRHQHSNRNRLAGQAEVDG